MPLTEIEIKKAKVKDKQYRMTDGGGMCLLVHPNGGKYWRLAYRFGGKQKTLALGVYPDITLAQARERREQARKLLANDTDPGAVKQAQKVAKVEAVDNSFANLALNYTRSNPLCGRPDMQSSGWATWKSTHLPS